jgi:hypothetical protein
MSVGLRRVWHVMCLTAAMTLVALSLAAVPPAGAVTSCAPAGYQGPIGCVLLAGSAWAPSLASLGDLNVYNNGTYLRHYGPDNGYASEYQCTELAIRFAAIVWHEGSNLAAPEDAWDKAGWNGAAQDMFAIGPKLPIPLRAIRNGTGAPQFGDLIVFSASDDIGHVGVVVKVSGGRLYFVGENQSAAPAEAWIPINSSNEASAGGDLGGGDVPLGWLRGPSWATQSTPNATTAVSSVLNGVSCPTATDCVAVGKDTNSSGRGYALAEQWNGTAWTLQSVPNPPSAKKYSAASLSGVSCPTATDCMAVGTASNKSGAQLALIEQWNGTRWAIQSVPNPQFTNQSFLNGVSCSTETACTAVGQFNTSTGGQFTLTERWNGKSWTVQSTPITAKGPSELNGVSCPSATTCIAVGDYGTHFISLIERWDGKSWAIQSTPKPVGYPQSVSCSSSTACIAVGAQDVERWDGTSWTIQTSTITLADPYGVSCPSTTLCVAVGSQGSSSLTLAEEWNGEIWSAQSTASPSDTFNGLAGVDCSSSTRCTAVGSYENSSGHYLTLAENDSSL